MSHPDLNLLVALDVLLREGNVARSAQQLGLSASAMSRTLARLREVTGDPLLVRAGRGLVPSPRALDIREKVRQLVEDGEAVLRPVGDLDITRLERTFTLRTSDGFVESFGPALVNRVAKEAPGVRLHFVAKANKGSALLRNGTIDLETGVIGESTGPEVRAQGLFKDRFIGVVRNDHELCEGEITPARYAKAQHVLASRRGLARNRLDDALGALGITRNVVAVVGGYSTALAFVRASELVATVPERHTANLRAGLFSFPLPIAMPEFTVSLLWHPRMEADPAHRWLRRCIRMAIRTSAAATE